VPVANVEYMREHLPRAELVVLGDANHFIPWTHPEVIREAIEKLAR